MKSRTPINPSTSERTSEVTSIEIGGGPSVEAGRVVEGGENVDKDGTAVGAGGGLKSETSISEQNSELSGVASYDEKTPNFGVQEVPQEVFDTLAEVMKQSKESVLVERPTREYVSNIQNDGMGAAEEADVASFFEHPVREGIPITEVIKETITIHRTTPIADVQSFYPGAHVPMEVLGPQPDGTYKMVVTIPEGYIEGIKTQAESDGTTANEWVAMRLVELFESWWLPPMSS